VRTGARTVAVDTTLCTEENAQTAKPAHFFDRLARRRVRHSLALSAVAVLTASVASALLAPAAEAALPLCGGNQTAHTAPRTCTNTKVIDGTAFTVVLDVTAAGVAKVTYTLDAPRAGETPIRVRWHEGINSGPSAAEVSGVILVGSTGPATLSLTALKCGGQIDMTAVFTSNGDSRGRVGGPFISIDTCATAPTTTATTTPPEAVSTIPMTVPSSSTSSPAPLTTSTGSTSAAVVLAATVSSQPAGGLPATGGSGMSPVVAGAAALVVGGALVMLTRRGLPFRRSE
jgi:LPXTG-motif cell wall-anchored protein